MPVASDLRQDYMEHVVLKPKDLNPVQPVQILHQRNIRLIDAVEQDLESAINNAYQKMNSKDLVAIISQMIID